MSATLTVRDETVTGELLDETVLEVPAERTTVRELIRSRVYQEVKDYNLKQPEYFRGLVQPTDAEKTLNGYRIGKARQVDWKQQFGAAAAFGQHRILVLVDDRQATDLDEEIVIAPGTQVSFLKLVPLVGG